MSERCQAIRPFFEPFEICRETCQDEWTDGLNAVETKNDLEVENIHYEGVEIGVGLRKNAAPDERVCSALRIDSDTDEVMGVVYGAFRCVRTQIMHE